MRFQSYVFVFLRYVVTDLKRYGLTEKFARFSVNIVFLKALNVYTHWSAFIFMAFRKAVFISLNYFTFTVKCYMYIFLSLTMFFITFKLFYIIPHNMFKRVQGHFYNIKKIGS
jgi:hypothetical protein